jgi:CRISP-associated protein Cas1
MAQGHTALNIGTRLIKDKLKNCVETLLSLPAYDHASAIREINAIAVALDGSRNINELRMFEARAAGIYFGMWSGLELNWKGSNRGHVPPGWNSIGPRRSDITVRNRYATHPINAMLNYAYMMLETQVHSATIEHGLDPTVGFIHVSRPGRRALIYDLMEPLRPLVDRVILRFALSQRFTAKDFLLSPTGVCRLHPKLAERISLLTVGSARINGAVQSLVDQLDVLARGKNTLPQAMIV